MKMYILPVSGGGFAVQLGFLKVIYEATRDGKELGIRPDIVLSSSGGNVAAYISMIGNWCDCSIIKNIDLLESSLFVESWTPSFFPTWIAFPLTRSIYRNGTGIRDLFNDVYTTASVVNTEVWSGTYNSTSQKAAFFCNKSLKDSLIKDTAIDKYIYDSEQSLYLNGNLDEIAKVCYASASIPFITQGVMINNARFIDGGMAYASPIVPMSKQISDTIYSKSKEELIQMYYYSSYNTDDKFSDSYYSNSIGLLIHSSLLQDRSASLNLFKQYGKVSDEPEIFKDVNALKLRVIMDSIKHKSYLMIFSPKTSPSITITNFKGKDVIKVIKSIENDFSIYLWTMKHRY